MDYNKIKLIVSDMDGTLLNGNSEVSPLFFKQFQKLQQLGIKFAVASGRQYYSLQERLKPYEDHFIYLAENGALVMQGSEEKFCTPIDPVQVELLLKRFQELNKKYVILCGKSKAYIDRTDPEFMAEFLKHYENYEVVENIEALKDEVILKVTLCDLEGAEKNSLSHFKDFHKDLQVKLSGKIWVDFNELNAHKGNALKAIQDMYNIKQEETMAFGDYLNDLELFDHAAIGYAVENAHEQVKAAAQHLTKSNEQQGVEAIIEKLLNSHEH